jgi:hypothetical protein
MKRGRECGKSENNSVKIEIRCAKKRECVKRGKECEKREINSVKIESGCAKRKMRVCEERKGVWEERKVV